MITTAVGTDWIFPGDGKPARQAPLGDVRGVAAGPDGSFYIADRENGMIMRVDGTGILKVIAGNGLTGASNVQGLPAIQTVVSLPEAVAVDRAGNVYFAEYGCLCVRKIATDGTISTVAGGGTVVLGDNGPAIQASIDPFDIALDSTGNLFIVDFANNRIRKVTPNGTISTVAGNGTRGFSGDGGPALNAALNQPVSLAVGPDGSIYVGDGQNNRIRKITSDGNIATLTATLGSPVGMTVSPDGSLNVSAGNVFRITPTGGITTLSKSFQGNPWKISSDAAGNLFVADSAPSNGHIQRIASDGGSSQVAGNGGFHQSNDGIPAIAALLSGPSGVAVDTKGNLYIADGDSRRIRKVTPDGSFFTIAGGGTTSPGDGGRGTDAALSSPLAIAVDGAGTVYFTESNNRVRKLTAGGILTTIAGGGPGDFKGDGGVAIAAGINVPQGIAVDGFGNIFLADTFNQRIRVITPDGTINTVAGHGEAGFGGDGGPAIQAKLFLPVGITVDSGGNLYIADTQNQRIRKVTPDGLINTIAGAGTPGFDGDGGAAVNAHLQYPNAVVLAPSRDIYISDTLNGRIRKISNGIISTVAGNGGGFAGDGGPPIVALFNMPRGLAFDAAGNLYIADTNNNRVREIRTAPPSFQVSATSVTLSATTAGAVTDPVNVVASSSITNLPFAVAFVTNNGAPWLKATPTSGSMPSPVQISADPSQLAAGTYLGTVTVIVTGAVPNFQNITVTLNVRDPVPPKLAVDTHPLVFSLSSGSAAATKSIAVGNSGDGALSFTAQASTASWLNLSTTSGNAPQSLLVSANPAGLSVGTYTAHVTISSPTGDRADVPVILTVNLANQSITLSQTGLTFNAASLSSALPSQTISVKAQNWTTSTSILSGGQWLSISPGSGASDGTISISASALNLNPGVYYGQVRVFAPGAPNSPQSVVVVLNVLGPTANPGAVVQPAGLIFTGSSPGSQDVVVSNASGGAISFTSNRVPWLVNSPSIASVPQDPPTSIVVQPNTSGLDPGVHRGTLSLLINDGTTRNVDVLVIVPQAGCVPSQLLPVFTAPAGDFSSPALWPSPIAVRVVDNCGNPMTSGAVVASFSNGDAPLNLTLMQDGVWSGTWAPQNSGSVKITVAAATAQLSGTLRQSGAVTANSGPPIIGAVVGSASLGAPPLAPGDIITIFGANLAPPASIDLGGRPLPLLYTSASQINAAVPYDLPPNTSQQLIVRRGTTSAVPISVPIATAQPAIFTTNGAGTGQGFIFVGPSLADASAPAKAGDAVVIYCAGLGPLDHALDILTPAPLSPLYNTANPVTLTIGNQPASVFFGGLTPGFIGLYQVNAFVPTGVTPGDQVPVVLTVAGQSSPPVTMSVR